MSVIMYIVGLPYVYLTANRQSMHLSFCLWSLKFVLFCHTIAFPDTVSQYPSVHRSEYIFVLHRLTMRATYYLVRYLAACSTWSPAKVEMKKYEWS